MVTALFGADGRTTTAHAGLLLAQALGISSCPTTLIRIAGTCEGMTGLRSSVARDLEIVEYRIEHPDFVGLGVEDHVLSAIARDRHVLLDLPLPSLADGALMRHVTLPVLAVGPNALDERFAAQALRDLSADRHSALGVAAAPTWLLGCGRSGGTVAAASFEEAMARALESEGARGPVRALPVTLPTVGRAEADALGASGPTARLLRAAILVLAAIEAATADPTAPAIDRAAFAATAGLGVPERVTSDDRLLHERLRDLADDLVSLERNGGAPDDDELAGAPLLDMFDFDHDPGARIMTGVVHDHQNWSGSRRIRTSQVYATDGATYARTLSRLYRLGRRADATADVH